jgi:hypothetical protein
MTSNRVNWSDLSENQREELLETVSVAIKNDHEVVDLKLNLTYQQREIYAGADQLHNNVQSKLVLVTEDTNPIPISKKNILDRFIQKLDQDLGLKDNYQVEVECGVAVGDTAIDFEAVEVLRGNTVKVLSAYPGQVLFIDFWATWCGMYL